ncbi:hypothetical protein FOL47_007607 [Perkinsus chesapeaki]|uniref:Uncharacterized protein n=1 Tax=Perkinsus chesapeaki TaxID=330153 RepID=A0A7J6LJ97_PERCH|nr:hypothetical protein FOL47_007607 [Perkinsus chesapeaki]
MLTTIPYLVICTLVTARRLEFYKYIDNPWVELETPRCDNRLLCPSLNYIWDSYFDTLLSSCLNRFVLGGYMVEDSHIVKDLPELGDSWDDKSFARLKEKGSRPGRGLYWHPWSYLTVWAFMERYPVDGFICHSHHRDAALLRQVVFALKKLNVTVGLSLLFTTAEYMRDLGLVNITDINFLYLLPQSNDQVALFNTDDFAGNALMNYTLVGGKPESVVLSIMPYAAYAYPALGKAYSEIVYTLHGDPKGSGSVVYEKSPGEYRTYYFFSQPRAIEKITLAKIYSLRGLMVSYFDTYRDLFPWDPSSLYYTVASNIGLTCTDPTET